MTIALITLAVGLVAGTVAQRSRFCFVGGLRDFVLVRDTELLKGVLAFFVTVLVALPLASRLGGTVWPPPSGGAAPAAAPLAAPSAPPAGEVPQALAPGEAAGADSSQGQVGCSLSPWQSQAPWVLALTATLAGLGLGFASTLANGCPLRQHVLAGQGIRDSWFYLAGFYAGAVVYELWILPGLIILFS